MKVGCGRSAALAALLILSLLFVPFSAEASAPDTGTGTGVQDQTCGPADTGETGEESGEKIVPFDEEVIFFRDPDFRGEYRMYSVGESLPDLARLPLWDTKGSWNDRISSMKIGKNALAYVCTFIRYGAPCIFLGGDGKGVTEIPDLHGIGWGDRISSVKIRDKDWGPEDDPEEALNGIPGKARE